MFHGCRRSVCSLACVFFILFMFFLSTCVVEAAASGMTSTVSGSNYVTFGFDENVTFRTSGSSSGTIISSAYYNSHGLTCHIEIPVNFTTDWLGDNDMNRSRYLYCYLTKFTASEGSVSNLYLKGSDGFIYSVGVNSDRTNVSHHVISEADIFSGAGNFHFTGLLCFDFALSDVYVTEKTVNFSYTGVCGVNGATSADSSVNVYDSSANSKLDDIKEQNETAETTRKGILSSITSFFGSFFENLIGVFVPEDGYFSDWFDRLNTLLSEKLGMLYAPFDLIISTLQAIYSADSTETGIPFPGIQWQDTWLVEPFTFTFESLGDSFDDLREKVYFATDTVLVFTFLMLLQSKIKLILEGSE